MQRTLTVYAKSSFSSEIFFFTHSSEMLNQARQNKNLLEMKAKTAKLEDFLCCLDTNPQDKTDFLVAGNLHFLHPSRLWQSTQYCHTAGMLARVGTHYSSLTVEVQPGSSSAECTVTVQPSETFLNPLLSICYLKTTSMWSAEM